MTELACGRHPDTDCPFWECCAWVQRSPVDIPTMTSESTS
jgi:hypothetical protein